MEEPSPALERFLARIDRYPRLSDAAITAGFVTFGLAWLPLEWPEPAPVSRGLAVVLIVALYLPLAWRRRYPLPTLVAVTGAIAAYLLSGLPLNAWSGNGWMVAAYTAGVYGRWRGRLWAGSAVAFTALIVVGIVDHDGVPGGRDVPANPALGIGLLIATNVAIVIWVWLFGNAARAGRRRASELAERTRQLERERELNARRAVRDERVRIARELHDVVAHHVSLMGVQAGAARRVLHQRPEQTEQALSAIERTSREAVRELHRLLGFLREGAEDGLAPQPSLRQIETLIVQTREAGLPVNLVIEGQPGPLPPAVDLSGYRIVQEALTNALRHAGPTTATVRLCYGPRELTVEVVDEGVGMSANGAGTGGMGLIGMRERVGLLGGKLPIERPNGGGFAVRAELPFDGEPA